MSIRLTVVSGLGPKEPAAFLLETEGLRLLLDLGQGPTPDMRPDPAEIGRVDALVLSHAHKDHCGALDLLDQIGDPPVYATRSVLDRIGPVKEARELPADGPAEVLGIPTQTGRSGHALGAIWIRFDVDGGLLYMGDSCSEFGTFRVRRAAALARADPRCVLRHRRGDPGGAGARHPGAGDAGPRALSRPRRRARPGNGGLSAQFRNPGRNR